jgi:alpha-beta hydrolase superfamily lysophospholipase
MSIDISIKYARLPGGLVYFYQHWIPENPKALVVFVHGFGDHSCRHDAFLKRIVADGFACAAFDQRGHGKSEGRRGHVESFVEWVEDLGSFIDFSMSRVPEETPLILVGYSMGALIAIEYMMTNARPVAGMVSVAGAFAPVIQIPKWKRRIAERLSGFAPKLAIDTGVARRDLTRDNAELEALDMDSLFHSRITLRTGREIQSRLALLGAIPQRIHTPMLLVTGSADRVCDPEGTLWFAGRLASVDKHFKIYDGMYHDMLHDVGREEVMDDIASWISTRAADSKGAVEQFSLKQGEGVWEDVSRPR